MKTKIPLNREVDVYYKKGFINKENFGKLDIHNVLNYGIIVDWGDNDFCFLPWHVIERIEFNKKNKKI